MKQGACISQLDQTVDHEKNILFDLGSQHVQCQPAPSQDLFNLEQLHRTVHMHIRSFQCGTNGWMGHAWNESSTQWKLRREEVLTRHLWQHFVFWHIMAGIRLP